MLGFVVGAVAGAIAAYFYRDEISRYVNERFPRVRNTAAERIGSLGEAASSALDRARTQIDSTVRTSQERLRATGTIHDRPGSDRPGT